MITYRFNAVRAQLPLAEGTTADDIVVDVVEIEVVADTETFFYDRDFAEAEARDPFEVRYAFDIASLTVGGIEVTTDLPEFVPPPEDDPEAGGRVIGIAANALVDGNAATLGALRLSLTEDTDTQIYFALDGTDLSGLETTEAFLPVLASLDTANAVTSPAAGQPIRFDDLGGAVDVTVAPTLGTAGNDNIDGTSYDDRIAGGAGNDSIYGDDGKDGIAGGPGNDFLEGNDGRDILVGGAGTDELKGGAGADTLIGGLDDDLLWGGEDDDVLNGGDGDDELIGESGRDLLNGGAGADYMSGDFSEPRGVEILAMEEPILIGGEDDPFDPAVTQADIMNGGAGNDTMQGQDGDDVMRGGTEDDQMSGGSDDDMMWGDDGGDMMAGDSGSDTVYGGLGDDVIFGDDGFFGGEDGFPIQKRRDEAPGDDLLIAGDGDDSIDGGLGADTILGGNGGDEIFADTFDGFFGGEDFGLFDPAANGDVVNGGAGADLIVSFFGEDTLIGGVGDDSIQGGEDGDLMNGGADDDDLHGGSGGDLVVGAAGNDTLDGGRDNDRLVGGAGADVFEFDVSGGIDQVADFGLLEGDRLAIDLSGTLLETPVGAVEIAALATVVNGNTFIEFAEGARIVLLGIDDTTGLAGAIDVTGGEPLLIPLIEIDQTL